MEPTYIGVIACMAGVSLFVWRREWMVQFAFFCSLFSAASVVNLPALGDASIPPGYFAVAFLGLSVWVSAGGRGRFQGALADNRALFIYAAWAVIGSYLLPRLFAGTIELPPMQMKSQYTIYYAVPLEPSGRNITQAVYILGTFAAAIFTTVIVRNNLRDWNKIVSFILVCGLLHSLFGFVDLTLSAAGLGGALDVFRNGNYAMVDQNVGGFHRISGVCSETSAFSMYGFVLLVFSTELWLRSIRSGLSGFTAIMLGFVLLITTSTSAYFGLSIYAIVIIARILLAPRLITGRILGIVIVLSLGILGVLLIAAFNDNVFQTIWSVFLDVTLNKQHSVSAAQRSYWSTRAFDAFNVSYGVGVGVGSFRSSSLIAAILGATGVLGAGAFLVYLARLFRPFNRETYSLTPSSGVQGAGAAAAWAASLGLAPALVSAAGADPGLLFGLFAGLAIGWFRPTEQQEATNAVTLKSLRRMPIRFTARQHWTSGGRW